MKTLDEMIDRDETVLFRAPRGRWPKDGLYSWLLVAAGAGFVTLTGLVSLDWSGLISLALILVGHVSILACLFGGYPSREGLVTDRRMLHRSGWFRRKLIEIPATDVKRVRAAEEQIRIYRQSGAPLDLGHPSDAWGLGVALAHVAGVAPPRLASRKALLAEWLHWTVLLPTIIAIAILPVTWLVATMTSGASLPAALGLGAAAIIISFLSAFCGIYISGFLTLMLLRPFFSHREVTDWLTCCGLFWPAGDDPKECDWGGRLLRRLARILYRR
jgi:hypothetical protein